MSGPVLSVFLFALFPVLAMMIGGVIAAFRPPTPQLGSAIQHFAAGTVFVAVAVELLPDVMSEHAPLATIIGFVLGVALMLLIRSLGVRFEQSSKGSATSVLGLVIAVGVDVIIDGFLIGIGFAAGAKQGRVLTVALTLELLSLGLATAASLHRVGASRVRSIAITSGLALLPLMSALVGATLLSGLSGPVFDAFLAFGVAALLYLVTEELLVEAHEVPETTATTSMFFAGFLLLLIINLLV